MILGYVLGGICNRISGAAAKNRQGIRILQTIALQEKSHGMEEFGD
jgi:hypothetical protein